MHRQPTNPLVRSVTDRLWQRDRLQMRVADALLRAVEPAPRRTRAKTPRVNTRQLPERSGTAAPGRWPGFRSVLCGVDFSEASRLALRYAAVIAARNHGALRVIYISDPLLTAAAAAALHDRNLVTRSAVELRSFVEKTMPAAARGVVRTTQQVGVGDAVTELIAAAAAARSDLIVVGTQGLTGASR